MLDLLKHAFHDWKDDDAPRMAAAMAYFTVFSLPPLLLIILMVVGVFVEPSTVEGRIESEMAGLLGPEGARQIQGMIRNVNRPDTGGPITAVVSVLALLVGATGAFGQLQAALNKAWEVEPDPEKGGLVAMLGKRLLSLGMILTIAFLLLVSLVLTAAVSAFGDVLGGLLPGGVSEVVLQVVQVSVSLVVVTALFALIFKILPDAEVSWRDVGVGALGTAVLFVAGKFLLGLYFARSDPGEAFGAAGSLALILVWIYYSAMIVFFGAEFTQAWAVQRGSGIRPDEDAVRVVEEKRHVRGEAAPRSGARGSGEAPGEGVRSREAARAARPDDEEGASYP